MGVACVWCGGPAGGQDVSREHLLPNWLNVHLRGEDGVTVVQQRQGAAIRSRDAEKIDLVVRRHFCRTCNVGWMSELEARAKPVLLPMIEGNSVSLLRPAQELIATWASKTLVVRQYGLEGVSPIPVPEPYRRHLHDDLTPPSGTFVWIGAYGGTDAAKTEIEAIRFATFLYEWERPDGMVMTLHIGALVLQILALYNQQVQGLSMPPSEPYLQQIWPHQMERSWPPGAEGFPTAAFNDKGFESLAGRFHNIKRGE